VAVAGAVLARRHAADREAKASASTRTAGLVGAPGASTAAALVLRLIVVGVAQTEEPHQPQHQQAYIENAEADHEDPSLRAHS
jgi:hypothetical protein